MKLIKVKMLGSCSMAGQRYEPGDVAEGKPRNIQPLIDCGVAETWKPKKKSAKSSAKSPKSTDAVKKEASGG